MSFLSKINFKDIYEGWRNHLMPPAQLKGLISVTFSERLQICSTCEHHSKNHNTIRPDDHCTKCGCPLASKTKCLSCSCPLDKWKALLDQDKEEEIKNALNEYSLQR